MTAFSMISEYYGPNANGLEPREAKTARDKRARELRRQGYTVVCTTHWHEGAYPGDLGHTYQLTYWR